MNINSTYPFQFIKNNQIDSVKMDDNISIISKATFNGCSTLKEVILPKNLIKIDEFAFSGCTNLTEIVIPEGTEEISTRAFADCKRLIKIILPNSIKKLGRAVFSGCENLEEVILPDTIQELPEELFLNCKKLKKVILPKNITSLPYAFFKGCKSLDIILSDIIDTLGDRCFDDCYKLEHFPLKVFKFGKYCFHNCRNLNNININVNTAKLPNGLFDGCLKLENITYDGTTLSIGKRTFRNCISLKEIPSFISNLNERAFENCLSLTDLKVKTFVIPSACFRGCKNLVKLNIDVVNKIGTYAFSGCKSLKEINLENISDIGAEAFSNCTSLRKVILGQIDVIKINTFMNCTYLEEINFNDNLEVIGSGAFQNCKKLKRITIPRCLRKIGKKAFAYMDSLEYIEVSPFNKIFYTPDHKILIENKLANTIVLYAAGLKDKSYSIVPFCYKDDYVNPISSIKSYAFSGAKNLEELHIPSCTNSIEYTAFDQCSNLKKLFIEVIPIFTAVSLAVFADGRHYVDENIKKEKKCTFPFTELYILPKYSEVSYITQFMHDHFNFEKVFLPHSGRYNINGLAFNSFKKLKSIFIPNNVSDIDRCSFDNETILNFEFGYSFKASEFDYMKNHYLDHNYRIIKLNNDLVYIFEDNKTLYFTKDNLSKYVKNIDAIWDNTMSLYIILKELIKHHITYKPIYDGCIFKEIYKSNYNVILENLKMNDKTLLYVLEKSMLFTNFNDKSKKIIRNNAFEKVLAIRDYIQKYDVKDNFLINKDIMMIDNNECLFKYYDANLKRLLILSKVFENQNTSRVNLNDLVNFLITIGAFSDNNILRQKVRTFISEKMFMEKLPNGNINSNYIVGDNIHRFFEFSEINITFKPEFAQFFIDNFEELMNTEKTNSGIIKRIYENFEDISLTSTSNKGRQRHLKVTIKKCIDYLSNNKFGPIPKNLEELYYIINCWYDSKESWDNAVKIYEESLKAPRNIFTQINYNEDKLPIYDNNPENDLIEEKKEEFTYEWLPKQDYRNLILGKLCNCCAHVSGVGQGIMRASMILDNCQNLVILDVNNMIVAKATLCLNRNERYAIFNNVEVSLRIDYKDLEKIYNAFMRGTKAFMDTYNQNNPKCPIKNISIGAARNGLKSFLTDDKHPIIGIQNGINFGAYSIESGRSYNGDWQESQRLVLKK